MPQLNAHALLHAVVSALRDLSHSGENRTFVLTHYQLSEADLAWAADILGSGQISITLDSAERTVWRESGTAGVWWGEYHEAGGKLVVRTIEVCLIPELAVTSVNEIHDGADRLEEFLRSTVDLSAADEANRRP